jgi:nitroreductase
MNMIFKRTSVRKYKTDAVSPEQIELLMKAGMAAPSAMNVQPWEFVVVQKRENLDKIVQFHPYSQMLKEAPLAIIVCADKNKGAAEFTVKKFWIQDCSAATENIMLQAAEMGLGSVWLGTYPKTEVCEPIAKAFNLPTNIILVTIIALGHPDGEVTPKNKFDKSKIHHEGW